MGSLVNSNSEISGEVLISTSPPQPLGVANPGDSQAVSAGNHIHPAETFPFEQVTPASVWEIHHTLNKFPSVVVVDSSGNEVEGSIQYHSNSFLTVTFSCGFSGTAHLN